MSDTRAASLVRRERAALSDALDEAGPEAPTILPDWEAAELLEHLLLREQRPDLLIGPKLPLAPIARKAEKAVESLRSLPWAERVERFRSGPQRFSPVRLIDPLMNTGEYFIHHEDLLRAQDGWEPRELPEQDQAQLWSVLRRMARMLVRADVDVTLVSPQGSVRIPTKDPRGAVSVHGTASELLLWAFGRDEVAQVSLQGEDSAVAALREAKRGF